MADPYLGSIILVGFTFAPRGWATCSGQLLPISQNDALFSLLGTTYGGDGQSTFALPDMRGRAPIHFGSGAGLSTRVQGETSGVESVTLTVGQIPTHTHPLNVNNSGATLGTPNGNFLAAKNRADPGFAATSDGSVLNSAAVSPSTGGSQSHSNLQPYLVMNYVIALEGIFPSRN
jgi:microcystin-dependent protein